MEADLGLTGNQYQIAVSILFVTCELYYRGMQPGSTDLFGAPSTAVIVSVKICMH